MNVRVVGLTKRYGGENALDGVTLDLEPGRIGVVLGLNGAGKSTLLYCLAGLIAPTRGHILFDGEPFHRDRVDVRQRFAFLPDFPLFFPTMSVLEHCAMTLRLYGKDDEGAEARVVELLRRFDLLAKGTVSSPVEDSVPIFPRICDFLALSRQRFSRLPLPFQPAPISSMSSGSVSLLAMRSSHFSA